MSYKKRAAFVCVHNSCRSQIAEVLEKLVKLGGSMDFKRYSSVQEFYNDTYEILMRHEAQNMILLGNLIIGVEGKDKTDWRDPINWLMATVSDEGKILLTALMTPPHNLTLYSTDNELRPEALDCLIEGLGGENIPGVMAEKALAQTFADKYAAIKGLSYSMKTNQRIYNLESVSPNIERKGEIRPASSKDMHFLPYWLSAFSSGEEYGKLEMTIPQDSKAAQYMIDSGRLYVLEVDGSPVSMAGFTRELPTSIGVAYVYTPPYFQRNGYASSAVAQLSQLALDKGYKRCVLYTDLSNPTSNSIYLKIGYVPVCDSLVLKFE